MYKNLVIPFFLCISPLLLFACEISPAEIPRNYFNAVYICAKQTCEQFTRFNIPVNGDFNTLDSSFDFVRNGKVSKYGQYTPVDIQDHISNLIKINDGVYFVKSRVVDISFEKIEVTNIATWKVKFKTRMFMAETINKFDKLLGEIVTILNPFPDFLHKGSMRESDNCK